MTNDEAIDYIREWCPYDRQEEIIKALEQEPCDKCVYSTSEGCQYDDITETIPPFETSDDAISRQAVLKIIDGWYEQNRDTDNIEDLIVLITYMDSVNPQKPCKDCQYKEWLEGEDCPAYEKKTGRWILARTFSTKLYDEYLKEYECSECYRRIRCTESQLVNYPYCHCGAKMLEVEE